MIIHPGNRDEFVFEPQLQNSWLVQRLEKPILCGGPNGKPFFCMSFGGGLINGGLSDQAMEMLSSIFSFDYMGASEFEWGIVPSCFKFFAENRESMVTGKMKIREDKPEIFYFCHKEHKDQIEARLRLFATTHYNSKEAICLDAHFAFVKPRWEPRVFGWLDCGNGFMFFVDEHMWKQTCNVLGIRTE